jgi:uncharacterized protein (DUF58 family)
VNSPSPGDPPASSNRVFSRLQLLARRIVEGLSTGLHRSPHKGASLTFKQHRPYVPGDEIRRLDWRAFARTDRFYIREYEQETNLRATLLVDLSGSMNYRGRRAIASKAEYAREVALRLATLLIQQQDAVGLITFDHTIRSELPARSRPSHLRSISETLAKASVGNESRLPELFEQVAPRLGRRGLVILLSDCFEKPSVLFKGLASLRHRQHEVLVFQIWDPDELDFPFDQWTRFESLEIPDDHLITDPATLRAAYLENLQQFRAELAAGCSRHRIDWVPLLTDRPAEDQLSAYLKRRAERRAIATP